MVRPDLGTWGHSLDDLRRLAVNTQHPRSRERLLALYMIAFLLLALVLMGLPALSGAQQTCPPDGDVNQNRSVTIADALLVFQQTLSLVKLDTCQQSIADVYPQPAAPDGSITVADALCIFQKALGLPSCLDSAPSFNEPPIANAGTDESVIENTLVMLSGSGSDPDGTIVSYAWEQTAGTTVALSGANTRNASFTAPEVAFEDGNNEQFYFELTVTDDDGATATAVVLIVVFDSYFTQRIPTADAGPDQTVGKNMLVTLSGSGSDPDGAITHCYWVQMIGTTVQLDQWTWNPSFIAPDVDSDEELVFMLYVYDDDYIIFATDAVTVTVLGTAPNTPPVANAGPDQSVDEKARVTLSGSGTDSDGTITDYLWVQTSGTTARLTDADTPSPSFTAPDVDSDEELVFELAVFDDASDFATDTVTIRVVDSGSPPQPPVEQNTLEISVFGEGDLRVASGGDPLDCAAVTICQGAFEMGDEIVIEASPDSGWAHERWVGCDQDSGARCTVFMDGDRFVSVAFRSTEPLEVEDHVIQLQADQLADLVEYDVANGVLVFEADTVGLSQWAIGDILLSGGDSTGSDDRSKPFARRILDIVDAPDSRTNIHTIQASLDDIFSSGSLSYRQQGEAVTASAAAPNSVVVAQSGDPAFPNEVTVNLTFKNKEGEDVVTVTGTLGLSVEPEFDIHFDLFGPLETRFVVHAQTTGSLSLDLDAGVELYKPEPKELPLRLRLPPIPAGPVAITPVIKLFLTVSVNVSNPINPTVTYSISTTAGAHYKSGHGTKPVFSVDSEADGRLRDPKTSLVLSAEAGVRGGSTVEALRSPRADP